MRLSACCVIAVSLGVGCSREPTAVVENVSPDDAGAGGETSDAGADARADAPQDSPSDTAGGPCPETPCGANTVCYRGLCVADFGPCQTDDECQDDTYCDETQAGDARCILYGPDTRVADPTCAHPGIADPFDAPVVKCMWDLDDVCMTPIVIDLGGDSPPGPEIVFVDYALRLVAIRGDNCEEVFRRDSGLYVYTQLAAADLDGDRVPEILGIDGAGSVVLFNNQGERRATSDRSATPMGYFTTGAAIANLDQAGPPEIAFAGMALRWDGSAFTTLSNVAVPTSSIHSTVISAVADVDSDGVQEIVTGNRILDPVAAVDETPTPVQQHVPAGFVAVAQFDSSTPEPEVVVVSPGQIRIYHSTTGNVVFGPYSFGSSGGPPTVADFDGDGAPEVGVAHTNGYAVFDPDCTQDPLPSDCQAPGVRWSKATRDGSSGDTGSSVFDFNGDGRAEVVYRDECWLRVYDGISGQVLFASPVTSGTGTELPIVADTDGDRHADIVVSATEFQACPAEEELGLAHTGNNKGVLVLQDAQNRWMPSRPIWNQHTYHITNINDDGTVPLQEVPNWQTWNNYRQNAQSMVPQAIPASDLTARLEPTVDPRTDCESVWLLRANICNRGATAAPSGIRGTFYSGGPGPATGQAICTATTTSPLPAGQCLGVGCEYPNPPKTPVDLWFVVDDDGAGQGVEDECKEGNNTLHMPESVCPNLGAGGSPPR